MSFRTFTPANHCPVCDANHSCAVTDDGLHHCHHRKGEYVSGWVYLGMSSIGFGMYRREDDPRLDERDTLKFPHAGKARQRRFAFPESPAASSPTSPSVPVAPSAASPSTSPTLAADPSASLEAWRHGSGRERTPLTAKCPQAETWAIHLGFGITNGEVFEQLGTEWLSSDDRNSGDLLCFPERNGQGEIVGYNRRYKDGAKKAVGRRGIMIPKGITPKSYLHNHSSSGAAAHPGPFFLVEGASDVLSLLIMRRNVLGRPSATGGGDFLVEFLRTLPRSWIVHQSRVAVDQPFESEDAFLNSLYDSAPQTLPQIVIVGENDRKGESGPWPGRAGAWRLAKRLADELSIAVGVVFPPRGHKDTRDFLQGEMKKAKHQKKDNAAGVAASAWDYHCSQQLKNPDSIQQPGEPMRHQDQSPSVIASVLMAATLTAGMSSALDLSDLSGRIIGEAVARARAEGKIPDPYAEEEEAYARKCLRYDRADFDRFPCSHPRYLGFFRHTNGCPWAAECRCEHAGTCLGCRAWLHERERVNFTLRFREAERTGKKLFRFRCCTADEYKSLRKALCRVGASIYCCDIPENDGCDDDGGAVFATALPGPRSPWRSAGVQVTVDTAIAEMEQFTAVWTEGKRPFSTSHDWKLIDPDERSRGSVFIGRIDPMAITNMRLIADTIDAIVRPFFPKDWRSRLRRCWEFSRLGGWNDAAREHLYACWFCGEPLPYREPDDWGSNDDWRSDNAASDPFDPASIFV